MRTLDMALYAGIGNGIKVIPQKVIKWQPETITQKNRIESDGGKVIDLIFMDRVILLLKRLGIYGNCKLLTDANFGVKKDGSGAVSKLYDISGNNNDAVQATGASQPIWSLVGGRGVITYDGVNDYLKVPKTTLSNYALLSRFNCSNLATNRTILCDYSATNTVSQFELMTTGSKARGYFTNIGARASIVGLTTLLNNTWYNACYSKNSTLFTLYLNGVANNEAITDATALPTTQADVYIGKQGELSDRFFIGGISSNAIFNIALTSDQIATLYNLGL